MKVLFIGGTGFISTAVSRMAIDRGIELYLLNRGLRSEGIPGSISIVADINNMEIMQKTLANMSFDVIVDWIAYSPEEIKRDLELFAGKCKQYVFISSATVYQKPPVNYLVTETTPLENPFWDYARNKIACEKMLMKAFHESGFPLTIVRPSYTYNTYFPVAIGGFGCFTLADRMLKGQPIIVHGDGTSLWVNTHAEDFANGILGLFGNDSAIGQAFHITSDEVLNWNQIYETMAEALGVKANIVHIPTDFIIDVAPGLSGNLLGDKAWSVVFDNSKIKSCVPEFSASIPFAEGIRNTVKWFGADKSRTRINDSVNQEMDLILARYNR
jgi:nucleoside-diphosphate-sugar epimerase